MYKNVFSTLLLMVLQAGCTVEVISYYSPPPEYLTDREIYDTVVAQKGTMLYLTRREIVQGDRAPVIENRLGDGWRCYTPSWRSLRYVWCTTERRLDTMLRAVHAGYEYEATFRLLPYGSLHTHTPIYIVGR